MDRPKRNSRSPDEHTAAEIRAFAKAMLNGRTKSDVLEAGYHRYAFHDDHLPSWLADDEKRHMRCGTCE